MVMTKDVDFDVQVKATLRDGRASNKIVASDIAQVKPGRFYYASEYATQLLATEWTSKGAA